MMEQEEIFAFLRDNLRLEHKEEHWSDHTASIFTLLLTNPVTGEVVTLSRIYTSTSHEA